MSPLYDHSMRIECAHTHMYIILYIYIYNIIIIIKSYYIDTSEWYDHLVNTCQYHWLSFRLFCLAVPPTVQGNVLNSWIILNPNGRTGSIARVLRELLFPIQQHPRLDEQGHLASSWDIFELSLHSRTPKLPISQIGFPNELPQFTDTLRLRNLGTSESLRH